MSPAPTHSWFKTGLHFCGSCVVTLLCWTLWIGLGALLVLLLYIALAKELPVPDYVLRRTEVELARSGLILKFGRARFDPTGKVLLEDVRVHTTAFEDPLLTCRLLYVRHDFWSLLSGQTTPAEIQIEGAALLLPAILAPGGTAEPLVRDLALTLRHHDHRWRVVQAAGRVGPLALTVQGEFTPPRRGAAAPALDGLAGQYLQAARRLAPVMDRLNAFADPALAVQLDTDAAGANRATVLFTATGAVRPWDQPFTAGLVAAGTSLPLGGAASRPLTVQLAIRHLTGPREVTAHTLRATLQAEVSPARFTGRALSLEVAAGSVTSPEGTLAGPVIHADLAAWPVLRTTLATRIEGEFLAAEVEAGLTEKSARIHASGRGDPAFINRTLARHTPRAAPFFVFGDTVSFAADAVLAPGWRFTGLTAWADAGRIDSRGVLISSARGRIDIAGTRFVASEARVAMGENHARGSYEMDFITTDYRMLLRGALRPVAISGWFRGDWWPAFWDRYFNFAGGPPTAEVDVQGRWKKPLLSTNFIRAQASRATVWGGDFEAMDATVFVRPSFTHGLAVQATRAGGTEHLAGSFQRVGVPGTRETARFAFDFTTDADPAVLGRMLEGRADDVLASLRFTRPPSVHAWGAIAAGVPEYHFTGRVADPFHYYGFPLEAAQVQGAVSGSDVQITNVSFSAGGGTGAGKATLSGPSGARRLGFDLFLNQANLSRTVRAVQEYEANRTGIPAPETEAKFVKQAANSRLDVALSALGDPVDLASFKGSGHAALTGAELGEINLFGVLSQVLSTFSLSFSSLKLDAARTNFDLLNGELLFPNFKVTGPSAAIDGRGKYTFATSALDFSARFRPYEEPGSLLAAAVSLVMNPLTSILELQLTGQLADPKWSVVVSTGTDPSKPSAPAPAPTAATPAPDAAPVR
ncbi:hypothetical protein Verru16b_00139 [Lacunisphaera limnophila]|uniref:Uncharacterized protein n=1 Tax=Lacunisphaera limnophila TaxID=1838286 RepID=A0A1I7PHL2_9BACT|nr:AsmA-like C-terminal region-containing protein [Lacunisphaera limnophila]AOS43098.1 hypothetical protein Verru16b_00139 [Lacunisphaera limnophila]